MRPRSCCRWCMTSCADWLRGNWPARRRGKRWRPPRLCMKRTCDSWAINSSRIGATSSLLLLKPCAASWSNRHGGNSSCRALIWQVSNLRRTQPTRHNAQHEEHLYPTDVFPFTYGDSLDPFSKRDDGILRRLLRDDPKAMPKIMHTQSAAEYWHRSGSLVHTDPFGAKDADVPDNVRIYAFGGTQHGPAADPPGRGAGQNLLNPADYRPQLRALLDTLDEWVTTGAVPPESVYPRLDNGTLVGWRQSESSFPRLPGVRYPEVIHQPSAHDLGPDFATKGVITREPPRMLGRYVVKVPRSNPDGNDLGTLLPAEVGVPVATFTGWNLRRRDVGAEDQLVSLAGSYIPLPRTDAEAKNSGDPRKSLDRRYGSFATYKRALAKRCDEMVQARLLLREDADRIVAAADRRKYMFSGGEVSLRIIDWCIGCFANCHPTIKSGFDARKWPSISMN